MSSGMALAVNYAIIISKRVYFRPLLVMLTMMMMMMMMMMNTGQLFTHILSRGQQLAIP